MCHHAQLLYCRGLDPGAHGVRQAFFQLLRPHLTSVELSNLMVCFSMSKAVTANWNQKLGGPLPVSRDPKHMSSQKIVRETVDVAWWQSNCLACMNFKKTPPSGELLPSSGNPQAQHNTFPKHTHFLNTHICTNKIKIHLYSVNRGPKILRGRGTQ